MPTRWGVEAAMTPDDLKERFTAQLGDAVAADVAWDELTLTVDAETYVEAARFGRDDPDLALDFFDCLSGVDEREEGFAVVTVLYSTEHRHRVMLRHHCAGGRDNPVAPSLTDLYRGADWHEREAWDMFGIEFDGHPGVEPRILTAENFEGWPLRKDFFLATREAKPWPGLKEPMELDPETGEPLEREPAGPGAAPGPTDLDEAMSEQAKRAAGVLDEETIEIDDGKEVAPEAPQTTAPEGDAVGATRDEEGAARAERARQKAAEMRKKKAEERAAREAAERGEEPAADAEASDPTTQAAEAARLSAAGDPRVASPVDRQEEGDVGAHATEDPGETPPGEESQTERAERAVEETQARSQPHPEEGMGGPPAPPADPERAQEQGTTPTGEEEEEIGEPTTKTGVEREDTPDQPTDEPAPGRHAGEPPTTQEPGEAPVRGGLRETIDEEIDAAAPVEGGKRPGSVEDESPEADRVPADDDADDDADDVEDGDGGDER
jgi:NADH:ubiquinone oxidoreductase subunit C